MGQRSMITAGCLEPDQHGQFVGGKSGGQTPEILQLVRDRQSVTARLARDANQDLVAVFGNVDSDRQGRSELMRWMPPPDGIECAITVS